MKKILTLLTVPTLLLATACSTTANKNPAVEAARSDYNALNSQLDVKQHAPVEYQKATEALKKTERLWKQGAKDEKISHQAYISQKRTAIAEAVTKDNMATQDINGAELKRKDVLLEQRSREANQAKALAKQKSQEAKNAKEHADALSAYAAEVTRKAKDLENRLSDLKTEQTDRGLILTLNSILFDVNKATLKSGATSTLEEVADFLKEYENRALVVEGFTDSSGAAEYNQQLSNQRAGSVKEFLIAEGIPRNRIEAKGYGEQFPVAANNNAAGRQQNRRVEIVIANEENQKIRSK